MAKHFLAAPTAGADHIVVQGGRITAIQTGGSMVVGPDRQHIGRGPQCALVLDDATVSAVHVEAQATSKGVHLLDLDSRNGTFLAGERIGEAWLNHPCEFQCGKSILRFSPVEPQNVDLGQETRFGPLVGTTPEMLSLFDQLRRFSKSALSIVVTGETGTGKELVARAIHDASPRRGKPFIPFNCAAVTDTLLEAELFGHERGAFTGADRARSGLFAEADGGTLFLDEVAEMSSAMQAKVLRVLQEGEVRAVGSARTRKIDVRTLFATHVDLGQAINKGRFRADLYFRIAQVSVEIPPLRRRTDDLPFLVKRILEDLKRPHMNVDEASMAMLKARSFPGNVRELRNLVEVALVDSNDDVLSFQKALSIVHSKPAPPLETMSYDVAKKEFQRRYYTALHAACRGNVSQIAKLAGKQRSTVRTYLQEIGLHASADDPGVADD